MVSVTFSVLCCVVAGKFLRVEKRPNMIRIGLNPALTLPIFAVVVVLLFVCVSLFFTLRLSKLKCYWSTLDAVFVASLVHMFLITALCAIVLQGFRNSLKFTTSYDTEYYGYEWSHHDEQLHEDCYTRHKHVIRTPGDWHTSDVHVFTAAFIMAYVASGMYVLYAMVYSCMVFWIRPAQENGELKEKEVVLAKVS